VRQIRLDELLSDSDECQEVAALAAASSQVSSSSVKSMKPNKRNFKRVGKSKHCLLLHGLAGRISPTQNHLLPVSMMIWMWR
jgi:hypothetical protein